MQISKEQERLAFLQLELDECQKIVRKMKSGQEKQDELAKWEALQKDLAAKVFEMSVLLGIEV